VIAGDTPADPKLAPIFPSWKPHPLRLW